MPKQLVLPLNYSEPTDFAHVLVTEANAHAVIWLKNWDDKLNVNFACLVGSQAKLLASVWGIVNQAHYLSGGQKLLEDWYAITERKYKSKCYVMNNPEFIEDEEVFLYLVNLIKEYYLRLLLVSEIPPSKWKITLPDLKSRISIINVLNC